jgi:hypothetical protein
MFSHLPEIGRLRFGLRPTGLDHLNLFPQTAGQAIDLPRTQGCIERQGLIGPFHMT